MHALMRSSFLCREASAATASGEHSTSSGELLPLELTEVPTGTEVLDWTVPREWNVREAWITGPDGERVVDFAENTLHVLGYSTPVQARLPLSELREHVFTDPDRPELVPYRTSYYAERWGFCIASGSCARCPKGSTRYSSTRRWRTARSRMASRSSRVGRMTRFSCRRTFATRQLANDNLSGVVLLAALAEHLERWISACRIGCSSGRRRSGRSRGSPGMRRASRRSATGSCLVRRGSGRVHVQAEPPWERGGGRCVRARAPRLRRAVRGARLDPMGRGRAAVLLAGVRSAGRRALQDARRRISRVPLLRRRPRARAAGSACSIVPDVPRRVDVLERNATYLNLNPKGEPQLGRRGLYRSIGGGSSEELALLWVLNQSDGSHSLLDIARRSGLRFEEIRRAADSLLEHDLLAESSG